MRKLVFLAAMLSLAVILSGGAQARSLTSGNTRTRGSGALSPAYCNVQHNVGKISISISNYGNLGNGWLFYGTNDCFTGQQLVSCEYPKGSGTTYLWAGDLWIGAVVGSDTLVSTSGIGGFEFHPDNAPSGEMLYRSTLDPSKPEYAGAVSEQDFIAVYADTCTDCYGILRDELDGRFHQPIGIEVTQRSYAWSFHYTEDFVLIDYEIKNIGAEPLQRVYVGFQIDADVHALADNSDGYEDDLTGFIEQWPAPYLPHNCSPENDLVNLAWTADNDGGLAAPQVFQPTPHIAATRILGDLPQQADLSYNWWLRVPEDYAPQAVATYRDLVITRGEPLGDRNRYHFLRNGEIDFDQARLATIGALDPTWAAPPDDVLRFAGGSDARYLLSCGPFDIEPGQTLPMAIAYIGGENFHTDENNLQNLPLNPDAWYEGVDFTDLSINATWAEWIYDNPGVDTDSDGYSGSYTLCEVGDSYDTIWRTGDGVPDFKAASSPPAPMCWLEPGERSIRVRWNGTWAENTRDIFSREIDFEGYNAYLSTTGSIGSFARIGSYDIEDYYRYQWDTDRADWVCNDSPFKIAELRCLYGDSCNDINWHPVDYTRQRPLIVNTSLFYFEPVLANASVFGLETPFIKRYPAAPRPFSLDPSDVHPDSISYYLTDDGYFKYWEYEFIIDDLLPGQRYWISITSFDYGPSSGIVAPLESDILLAAQTSTPSAGPFCCSGSVGDINCDGNPDVTIGDVAVLLDHLFISGISLCCLTSADINQSGGAAPTTDDISIGDVAILLDYLYITGESLGLADCM